MKEKNVLVLFGADRPDNRHLLDLIEGEMRPRVSGPITFYETYLTSYDNEKYTSYVGMGLDLVIAVYPQAVSFATRYRDKMFQGVPVMFAGVGTKADWEWTAWPGVPGATFAIGLQETLDLALRLHPDTKGVAVVAGPDWGWIKEIHSELLRRNLEEVDIIEPGPDPEVLKKVAALPPHTAIEPKRSEFGSADLIRGVSQILPTYSAWKYICLDFGCIGGAYADEQKNVAATAEIAGRILSGERLVDIPVVHNTDVRATVDSRALQRWHVPDLAVPPGTLVLYREPTLWKQGRKYFLAAIGIIIAQALTILGLFWQRRQKRRTEAQLRQSEGKFSKSFLHSPLAVSITRTKDSRFVDVNEPFVEQFGWLPDEVIGRTADEFDLWVDTDQQAKFLKQLRANGSVRNVEACLRRKNGDTRTALVSAELVEVGGEPCTVAMAVDITERKQAEEVLAGLSRQLIEAQEQERTRIARELHDDITQRLSLLCLQLSNIREGVSESQVSIQTQIEDAVQTASDLGDDVQKLSHSLHSSTLEILGLAVAADRFCKDFSRRQDVEIVFQYGDIPQNLPWDISLSLFRILQEALQNALKYSGTRRFEAALESSANEIHLSVRDSGVGFDPNSMTNQHGLGLVSMRERLKMINGRLSIDSKPQYGTTIHATVPLDHAQFDVKAKAATV